jgi:2-hydroxychromene-2-carboxylate isomerase
MSTPIPHAAPKTAIWYFDVVSPFSYLSLGEIEQLAGTITIVYRPVLFAALLAHWKHLGPAEIPPKRIQHLPALHLRGKTARHQLRFPPFHPFNPLRPPRLIAALDGAPHAVRIVMDKIWRDGLDLSTEENWHSTCAALGLTIAAADALVEAPEAKAKLRANTDAAIAARLFGVPTLEIGDELFWGADALPMARAYLENPDLFKSGEMLRVATLGASSSRAPAAR